MKSFTITTFFLLACVTFVVYAGSINTPFEHIVEANDEAIVGAIPVADEPVEIPHGSRQKRATCDLASFLNPGDSLCAAHCIAKRFRGGYCNSKKVCVCRR